MPSGFCSPWTKHKKRRPKRPSQTAGLSRSPCGMRGRLFSFPVHPQAACPLRPLRVSFFCRLRPARFLPGNVRPAGSRFFHRIPALTFRAPPRFFLRLDSKKGTKTRFDPCAADVAFFMRAPPARPAVPDRALPAAPAPRAARFPASPRPAAAAFPTAVWKNR